MKNLIITAALAVGALFVTTNTAEAGGVSIRFGSSHGSSFGSHGHSSSHRSYGHSSHSSGNYCAPRIVRSCVINRCTHTRVRYDRCGRKTYYRETVVTYRDYYSNGATRTRSQSYYS